MIVGPAARMRELGADQIVHEIAHTLAVPGGDFQPPTTEERDSQQA